jgi:hypothetical protein
LFTLRFADSQTYIPPMNRRVLLVSALIFGALPIASAAQDMASVVERWQADHTIVFDASEVDLADLAWIARPVVVFADNPNQPQFVEQMRLLQADAAELDIRDVIIIVDTDPAARSSVRQTLRPRGFSLVLIDKDGRVNLRKPDPWSVREIARQIDKMPLRLQEVREGLAD